MVSSDQIKSAPREVKAWLRTFLQRDLSLRLDLNSDPGVTLAECIADAIRTTLGRGIINRAEQNTIDRHLPAVRTVPRDGDPATELLATIVEEKPDLFVIGRRGLGGLQKLLIGSVLRAVSSSADSTAVLVR